MSSAIVREASSLPRYDILSPLTTPGVSSSADPLVIMMAASSGMRTIQTSLGDARIEDAMQRIEIHDENQRAAFRAAERAARRASRRMKPRLRRFFEVTAAVAGAALAPLTGGTSAALAVAGSLLMTFADDIAQGLVGLGLLEAENAQWVALGLMVVGGALALSSPAAASRAATTGASTATVVARVAEVGEKVKAVLDGVSSVVTGSMDGFRAVNIKWSDERLVDALGSGALQEDAMEDVDDELDGLRRLERHATAIREHVSRAASELSEAHLGASRLGV